MDSALISRFRDAVPAGPEFCSLRYMRTVDEMLSVRQNVLQPIKTSDDAGVMVTVIEAGGLGYAATSDTSANGLRAALAQAREWAARSRGRVVDDMTRREMRPAPPNGSYESPVRQRWNDTSLADKIALLGKLSADLKRDDRDNRIVDWEASLWHTDCETAQFTIDRSGGAGGDAEGEVRQRFSLIVPNLSATANRGSDTVTRTFGGRGYCRQGGLEVLDDVRFADAPTTVVAEALQLLDAPNCPTGTLSVLLDPGQMILQIHESIGHPLELDRILGDERNYAGTSFVTPDMFGTYRYGSDLLNITFDPTVPGEFAAYGFDDEGVKAEKVYLIRHGILQAGLGSAASQRRLGVPGVACSRSTSWNRPPIDRMANLNLEVGDKSLAELIAGIERGVFMKTNCSWSIDDSRNKFQFGCEWGQLIEDGKLTTVVKNPNYRGISSTFWRSLAGVGDASTFEVMGTPFCGKGEPNQIIKVGHATPTCRFRDVDVFGGA
ncbi:MAG: TldD/PmbA family protein [Planctomycetota bacterium]